MFSMSDSLTLKARQLLHTARELFYRYGVQRVTVEEICARANVSKVTFYKHFKNKNDLFVGLIRQMMQEGMDEYKAIFQAEIPFSEKVRQMTVMKKKYTESMSYEMMQSIYANPDPDVQALVREQTEKSMELHRQMIANAKARGDIRPDVKPEFVLYFMNKLIEIANDEQLKALYESPQEMSIDLLNFMFYGILSETGRNETLD